ncbi:MAG: D-alanyl-D-alanine carboxypeptidase [Clostridia bacterium]|nr:D-alanyl-D-alanine carboxypeptidase [Clostridia bacterium]
MTPVMAQEQVQGRKKARKNGIRTGIWLLVSLVVIVSGIASDIAPLAIEPVAVAAAFLPVSVEPGPDVDLDASIANLTTPPVSVSGTAMLVLESNRSRILFEQNSAITLDSPVSAKLMTALIASEQLKPETMITISSVTADMPDLAVSKGQPALKTGEKYSFEYLLLRLVFYDSDAAAVALAEQISGEESEFIQLMNSKAQSLDMLATTFVSSSGRAMMVDSDGADPTDTKGQEAAPAATTLRDLARLVKAASQNKTLSSALTRRNEYLVLPGPTVISLHHQLETLWTLSEDRVSGAFFSNKSNAATVTFGTANGIAIITLIHGGRASEAIDDTVALYNAVGDSFEVATLVEAGDHFFGGQEQTVDGEAFGLIYLKTITYVRPKGQDYLDSAVQYQSFGPFTRPILSGAVIGQAIFKLLDGTTVAVDVGPDRQILSSVTLIDRALKQLQGNQNLTIVLLATLILLIIVLAAKVLINLTRLIKLSFLILFEIRSRR